MSENKKLEALAAATANKVDKKSKSTQKAIKKMLKDNIPFSIAEVARQAGVSRTYLYYHSEFRLRIEDLIKRQGDHGQVTGETSKRERPSEGSKASVNATLKLKIKKLEEELKKEKEKSQKAYGKIRELERAIIK